MARNDFEGTKLSNNAEVQYDHSNAAKDRQFATASDGDPSGGNCSAKGPLKPWNPYFVPDFMGRSGQPDNQSTSRAKGST